MDRAVAYLSLLPGNKGVPMLDDARGKR